MSNVYRTIMDSRFNPLSKLPAAQRFQLMVGLSVMWTTIFCAGTGVWIIYGQLLAFHLLVALGFLITGITFYRAQKITTYRDQPLSDGTARYDDVWGA